MSGQINHSENLRKYRSSDPGLFFVTKCLDIRKPVLFENQRQIISEALIYYYNQQKILLTAFVVMPDHWHALIAPNQNQSLSNAVTPMQSWISKHTADHLHRYETTWQSGFYETRIRSSKQFNYVCSYIENNPVKKGLTEKSGEWRDSSAHIQYADNILRPWPWQFEYD